jgi:hypothetical protein
MPDNQSLYDPSRPTVGAIYRDAQMSHDGTPIQVGDMSNEMMVGLVEDINDGLMLDKFEGRPFYLMIHEKKDLQMKSTLLRRVLHFAYRPWPEDDTTVFWKNPQTQEVRFCWSLPHWSEMDNMLANSWLYEPELIQQIKNWKNFDLHQFGFTKNDMGDWVPNPFFKDKPIEEYAKPRSKVIKPVHF